MDYPDNCLRGIPNSSFLVEDGSVASHLFGFDRDARDDGWIEESINWEDDDNSINLMWSQKKEDGQRQFKIGVAVVPRSEIDRLSTRPTVDGILSYERQPLEHNCYHGNLLLSSSVPKPTKRKIGAGLALAVSKIIRQSDT